MGELYFIMMGDLSLKNQILSGALYEFWAGIGKTLASPAIAATGGLSLALAMEPACGRGSTKGKFRGCQSFIGALATLVEECLY